MRKSVVITGIGVLSPIGIGNDQFWQALVGGKPAFSPVTLFDTSPYAVHKAGEIIGFDPVNYIGKKGIRELDRATRLLCSAAALAAENAGFKVDDNTTHQTGVSVGTTFGSLHSIAQFDLTGLKEGPRYVNPSFFPNTVINSPASRVSIRMNIKGFNTTISTGFCAGLDAAAYAADFIRNGRVTTVFAGAVEELCEETFALFHHLKCLSGMDGYEPICCPFDARRNGFLFSEGAGMLILEEASAARLRGATIHAEIVGYGSSFDHQLDWNFSSSGKGLKRAIELALRDASLLPQHIDYVVASANSSPGLDRMEARILTELFGKSVLSVSVSAIKSTLGEAYSASGIFGIAAAVNALRHGIIPPTVNFRVPDPDCVIDCVANDAIQGTIRNVLVLAVDPYGNNTAVIVGEATAQ